MAIEAARAGGVGVLDAVHLPPGRHELALANLRRALDCVPAASEPLLGLRLAPRQMATLRPWLELLGACPHWLILADWAADDLATALADLATARRAIWLEVGGPAEISAVDPNLVFHGWAGCGAESGGLAGSESSFVLAQRLARLARPFTIRGGVGVHTAAACAVAGAEAVILDDVLHLLRESGLPPRWRHLVGRLGLTDTSRVGGDLGRPVRVLRRPEAPASGELLALADRLSLAGPATASRPWAEAVASQLGWDEPEVAAWPVGEGIGLARAMASRYRSVGAVVRAVSAVATSHIAVAAARSPLDEGTDLAAGLGTRYPIVQGPMTRVSDTIDFAAAVAAGGALPLLALALMHGPEVAVLLASARARLGEAPWGVGILGFVPAELRREQMAVIERVRPPFALIAGGRPDQVAELEAAGVATFLHVPAPLLDPFLRQGVRRIVLEGGECGGHVGPLHSFTLWEHAVDTLAGGALAAAGSSPQVLFAGGIHDDVSAAMVAALSAPLSAHGIQCGVLMGTAYLFTEEAVRCGAVTKSFQHQAISSGHTTTIETGPGHVIRCAPTPFATAFATERQALAASGLTGQALSGALDRMIVGRSRLASKGLERVGDELVPAGAARQHDEGLYMLGEVAALRSEPTTIAALHRLVSSGGSRRLKDGLPMRPESAAGGPPAPADVAIVGVSCLVPGASDPDTFWRNLLAGRRAISEIPAGRWDWRLYYDEMPAARDRMVSKWGGFIDPIPFDPLLYGIPPKSLRSITPPQLLALELTRRALVDAGFPDARPEAAVRERTAVVFAIGNTADLEQLYMTRATLPLVVGPLEDAVRDRLPEWTEESYPGLLPSVTAGRVANRFDFGGANLTIDAACASSFAALDVAVSELVDKRSDLVVAGGFELEMSPQAFLGFSHTRALSPRGRADVFDRDADGIVISEGGVVVVLKRLADAERDGDRIYAVIKAVAASSDGRGLSMTAPKPAGQKLALTRAYQRAGIDPRTLRMYEAHATGTQLGDAAEADAIDWLLARAGAGPDSCAIGSAKSLIGHTRTAAGMVALLKVALSLRHRVVPPHAGVATPLAPVAGGDRPLYLLAEAQPWLAEAGHPRRASASAFGFGGTNYHVVLEERRSLGGDDGAYGADSWPSEVFVLAAADAAGMRRALERLDRAAERLQTLPHHGAAAPAMTLRDLAYVAAVEARGGGACRVAIVVASSQELRQGIAAAGLALSGESADVPGVYIGGGESPGAMAWLFPGQGSQYPGMGRELAAYVPELGAAVASAADLAKSAPPLASLMWPRAAFSDQETALQRQRLAATAVAQPAIGAMSCGLLDALWRVGMRPAAVAGHSFGELVALHAAGCLDRRSLFALAVARGQAMGSVDVEPGGMAMLACSAAEVVPFLALSPEVVIANRNAPGQVVVSGPRAAVREMVERVRHAGHAAGQLPVSGAFHSPLMRPARAALDRAIADTAWRSAAMPVHANVDGRPYPSEPDAIAERLAAHLEQPVDFVAQVEAMYAAGVRTFLEVGPGHVLTGLVRRILADRPHRAVATDGGLQGFQRALGVLHVAGHAMEVAALFDGRAIRWVDLDRLPEPASPHRGWWVDGGRVWEDADLGRSAGRRPFLDATSPPATAPAPALPALAAGVPVAEVYRQYEETMRRFLDQQERMLLQVLGLPAGIPPTALPAVVPTPARGPDLTSGGAPPATQEAAERPAARRAVTGGRDPESLVARLAHIVGDRTGYAQEVIGVDLDLEADLGVDSIKRIEILATFAGGFAEPDSRRLQAELDRLTRLRTLRAIATAAAAALARATADGDAATAHPDGACPRFVVTPVLAPATGSRPRSLSGLHLVTMDGRGIGRRVADALALHGAQVAEIASEDLLADDRLVVRVAQLREQWGPVRGIVHLAALGRTAAAEGWRGELRAVSRSLFALLKSTAADLVVEPSSVVLAATALGGSWGRDGCRPGAELAAACHGLLRSFEREHPAVSGVVVDVDDSRPEGDLARELVDEYLAADEREVGYRDGRRWTLRPVATPLAGSTLDGRGTRPAAGWVVLATGGTRGITAEICAEVAAPGVRFVLVGRGSLPSDPAAELERRRTIQGLRAAGAEVESRDADVADDAAFGALIDDVYRQHGRIDAVLHGAGAIHDQRFELKSAEAFERMFGAKVGAVYTLARHLRPEGLRWVVLFGSVAGRFGNPGQTDYAAANEVLNRLAWSLHRRWPATRVLTINWGPWRGTGMASEATVELLRARGVHPIAPAAGRRFLVDELVAGGIDDCEVVAGVGPWAADAEVAPSAGSSSGPARGV
jgi:acyl transferase domain-containing protein/NAD(P)H-dependent flavin oxidoreductase YrpB (nitropropane dioxygenase family)/NAD(P)-dependent dehydrogenase (short-subunit alcohol dehydrogenase family)